MTTPKTFQIDVNVALNTLAQFARAAARSIYANSPDRDYFDGSAEGYWQRVARECGATEDEIAEAGSRHRPY